MFSFDLLLVDFGSGGLIFFKDKFLSDQDGKTSYKSYLQKKEVCY